MKVGIFNRVPFRGPGLEQLWPRVPPGRFSPAGGLQAIEDGFAEFQLAHDLGFDHLSVAEHHNAPRGMTPNPVIFAAALSQRIPDATIAVLGAVLPLLNPVRVAEEFAMLDLLTGGKLIIGLFRGTPSENITYGMNPDESRAKFQEGFELFLRALTEPEPFSWEGIYYRSRSVAIWPHPVQLPRPKIVMSGNSLESAEFAARYQLDMGLSFDPQIASVEHYRAEAARHGWTPTEDNLLYRDAIYVAETDEIANEQCTRFHFGTPSGGQMNEPGRATHTRFVGSPETVLAELAKVRDELGVGRFDLYFSGDLLPYELSMNSIRLFGEAVLPELHLL